ncbi:MAG: recombinase family protein [Clostridiales bacterium]|nr:recombinase family protein [Clostridiales bacterium]
MKTAAAYIRVSTADQLEYSPDSQLRLIKDYAQRNQIVLDADCIFQDDGISGRNAEKRPAFQKMISCAKKRLFDVILIYSTSRFARNLEDSIVYKSMLQRECGIEVISITQPFVDRKTDMLTSAIYGVMDEWYSIDLAENVRRGMTQKALSGGFQTSPPLGYKAVNKELIIVEGEAETIRFIFDQYLNQNIGFFGIAKKLNQMGVKTKRGRPIENRTVQYILRNPVYKGFIRWTPTGKTRRNFDNSDSITAQSTHIPIIPAEIFDAVQEKYYREKKTTKRNARPLSECRHWLSGMVRCDVCGCSLVFGSTKYLSMQCNGYNHGTCTVSHYVTAPVLEKAIFDKLDDIISGAETDYKKIVTVVNRAHDQASILSIEKSRLLKKLERAKEAYLSEIDTADEYRQNKQMILKEIERVDRESESIKISAINPADFKRDLLGVYGLLQSDCDMLTKQNAIRSIIDKIVFCKKGNSIEIYFYR